MTDFTLASAGRKYSRAEAAALLTEIGVWTLPIHLLKHSIAGTGPPYATVNGIVYYSWEAIIRWSGEEAARRRVKHLEKRAFRQAQREARRCKRQAS